MVVSKADSNEKTDVDILQCKADILRARDIIQQTPPPYKKKAPIKTQKSKKISENTTHSADTAKTSKPQRAASSQNKIPEAQAEQIKPGKDTSPEPEDSEQEKARIPRFDLAEEIMAEQRKITAIKRKAPGKKIEAQSRQQEDESIGYAVEQPILSPSEQNRVIAEIVARDIESLCRGDTWGARGQNLKDTSRDSN